MRLGDEGQVTMNHATNGQHSMFDNFIAKEGLVAHNKSGKQHELDELDNAKVYIIYDLILINMRYLNSYNGRLRSIIVVESVDYGGHGIIFCVQYHDYSA